ncbi:hypothetical protein GA0115259_106787, partial [Streptomyces sp. MnatMP-M17]
MSWAERDDGTGRVGGEAGLAGDGAGRPGDE